MIYSLLARSAGVKSIIEMIEIYGAIILAYFSIPIIIILIIHHINKKNKKH